MARPYIYHKQGVEVVSKTTRAKNTLKQRQHLIIYLP